MSSSSSSTTPTTTDPASNRLRKCYSHSTSDPMDNVLNRTSSRPSSSSSSSSSTLFQIPSSESTVSEGGLLSPTVPHHQYSSSLTDDTVSPSTIPSFVLPTSSSSSSSSSSSLPLSSSSNLPPSIPVSLPLPSSAQTRLSHADHSHHHTSPRLYTCFRIPSSFSSSVSATKPPRRKRTTLLPDTSSSEDETDRTTDETTQSTRMNLTGNAVVLKDTTAVSSTTRPTSPSTGTQTSLTQHNSTENILLPTPQPSPSILLPTDNQHDDDEHDNIINEIDDEEDVILFDAADDDVPSSDHTSDDDDDNDDAENSIDDEHDDAEAANDDAYDSSTQEHISSSSATDDNHDENDSLSSPSTANDTTSSVIFDDIVTNDDENEDNLNDSTSVRLPSYPPSSSVSVPSTAVSSLLPSSKSKSIIIEIDDTTDEDEKGKNPYDADNRPPIPPKNVLPPPLPSSSSFHRTSNTSIPKDDDMANDTEDDDASIMDARGTINLRQMKKTNTNKPSSSLSKKTKRTTIIDDDDEEDTYHHSVDPTSSLLPSAVSHRSFVTENSNHDSDNPLPSRPLIQTVLTGNHDFTEDGFPDPRLPFYRPVRLLNRIQTSGRENIYIDYCNQFKGACQPVQRTLLPSASSTVEYPRYTVTGTKGGSLSTDEVRKLHQNREKLLQTRCKERVKANKQTGLKRSNKTSKTKKNSDDGSNPTTTTSTTAYNDENRFGLVDDTSSFTTTFLPNPHRSLPPSLSTHVRSTSASTKTTKSKKTSKVSATNGTVTVNRIPGLIMVPSARITALPYPHQPTTARPTAKNNASLLLSSVAVLPSSSSLSASSSSSSTAAALFGRPVPSAISAPPGVGRNQRPIPTPTTTAITVHTHPIPSLPPPLPPPSSASTASSTVNGPTNRHFLSGLTQYKQRLAQSLPTAPIDPAILTESVYNSTRRTTVMAGNVDEDLVRTIDGALNADEAGFTVDPYEGKGFLVGPVRPPPQTGKYDPFRQLGGYEGMGSKVTADEPF